MSKEIGEESLHDYMLAHKKPGIAGVDTRALTIHLRDHGAQKAYLHVDGTEMSEADAIKKAQEWEGLDGEQGERSELLRVQHRRRPERCRA